MRMTRTNCWVWVVLVAVAAFVARAATAQLGAEPVSVGCGPVQRKVMAFYYPWYGTADGPGGAGRTVHWGRIDAEKKDIAASTHYPELGAYDSHDPMVIEQHCRWAKEAGIDTFIVSWWGHGHYTDRAMDEILDGCGRHGLTACVYYETVPRPQTSRTAADDIVKLLDKYGEHPAHLKVDGKPVVFVYGRALQELGLTAWLEAVRIIKEKHKEGVAAIGDQFSYGAARVFDGVHTYNTAGSLRGLSPAEARKWAAGTYQGWVKLADDAGKISTLTIIPGYDDTKIRKPGLAVERFDGELYRLQWEEAIKADPHWILITSFNEWHEGSEMEPSLEHKRKYLGLTGRHAKQFKAKPRIIRCLAAPSGLSPEEKSRLRDKLKGIHIAVLDSADSPAFWWLLDLGADVQILSWEDVAKGMLRPQRYSIALYCAGEHYRRTVSREGDVDDALVAYLKAGGCLTALPALPLPFYYDRDGKAVSQSGRFGLTLRGGWEDPPRDVTLRFVQPQRLLKHLPGQFAFPASGDLRWRPCWRGDHERYVSLLALRDGDDKHLGDAVAYGELKDGGRVLYTWFGLLNGPDMELLLYDVFDFLADQMDRR